MPEKNNFNKINYERKYDFDFGTFNFTLLVDQYYHNLIFIRIHNVPSSPTSKVKANLKLI